MSQFLRDFLPTLVKTFYDEIEKRYKMTPGKIDYDQFKISDDGKTLFWIVGEKEISITAKQGSAEFLSLGTQANEYNRVAGRGGTLSSAAVFEFTRL